MGYNLIHLTSAEQEILNETFCMIDERLTTTFGIFETPPPQLVFFDNMFKFVPESKRQTLATRGNRTRTNMDESGVALHLIHCGDDKETSFFTKTNETLTRTGLKEFDLP